MLIFHHCEKSSGECRYRAIGQLAEIRRKERIEIKMNQIIVRLRHSPHARQATSTVRKSTAGAIQSDDRQAKPSAAPKSTPAGSRSEERRVGKECRSRWSPDH